MTQFLCVLYLCPLYDRYSLKEWVNMDYDLLTFGEYLSVLLNMKNISISKMANLTNTKSRNTIQRLLKDESSIDIIQDFKTKLVAIEPPWLTSIELELLEKSVGVSRIGKDKSYGRNILLELFAIGKRNIPTVNNQLQCEETTESETLSQVFQSYSDYSSVNILVFDATIFSVSDALISLSQNAPNTLITIEQIIFMDDDINKNADIITSIHRLLNCKNYNIYYSYSDEYQPKNKMDVLSNFIVVDKISNAGLHSTDLVKIDGETHISVLSDNPGDSLYSFHLKCFRTIANECQKIQRTYACEDPLDKLIQISDYHMNLEKSCAEYVIKQNMCFTMVPSDILYDIFLDSDFIGLSEDHPTVQKLIQLTRERFDNYYRTQKMKVHILTSRGLLDFVKTGFLTDHIFCFRPFTKKEIKFTLEFFLNQIEINPLFKIYLLQEDNRLGHIEYDYYENQALCLMDSFSGYNEDYADWVITAKPIINIIDDFIKNELIPHHTLPESETIKLLTHLISTIE